MNDQNCLIWVFLGWNSAKLLCCDILHQHPQIFLNAKFQPKIKLLKFGTKTALILLSARISKTNVVFEISIFEIVNMKVSFKNKKTLNMGPKILDLGIFELEL